MKLTDLRSGNFNAGEWEAKGYLLPKFDMAAVAKKTHEEPTWVHFGGGNIFRAFPAAILNDALNTGKYDRGVIVAETFDYEVIDKAYAPYDNLSLAVSLCSNGTIEKKVIASVTEALKADYQFDDWKRLVEIFRNPSLQMISFTITEKGYGFNDADLARGMQPVFAMGKVTALLYERFLAPIPSGGVGGGLNNPKSWASIRSTMLPNSLALCSKSVWSFSMTSTRPLYLLNIKSS